MADADFTFNPDITITPDHQIELSGTVDPGVRHLQIFDQTGGVPDFTFKPNGTWTATYALSPNTPANYFFKAEYDDASGQAQTVKDSTYVFHDLQGYPFTSMIAIDNNPLNNIPMKFYSSDDSLNSHLNYDQTTHVMTETGDELHAHFEYDNGDASNYADQTITNFHLGTKYSHDSLLLPHQDFANMTELLRETSMVGGNAVIHDHNGVGSLTLTGVTKDQMKAHPSDFSFGTLKRWPSF